MTKGTQNNDIVFNEKYESLIMLLKTKVMYTMTGWKCLTYEDVEGEMKGQSCYCSTANHIWP